MHHRDRIAHADLLATARRRKPQARHWQPAPRPGIWRRLILPLAALLAAAIFSLHALLWLAGG